MNKTYFYRRSEDKVVSDVATKVTLPKLDSIKVQNLGGEVCQIEFDNDIDDTESITLSSLDGGYNSIELNFGPEYINMKTVGEGEIPSTGIAITGIRAVKAKPTDITPVPPVTEYHVFGIISDMISGLTLQDVDITIFDAGMGEIVTRAVTDEHGKYFSNQALIDDNYNFQASKDGYVTALQPLTISGEELEVNLALTPIV